MWSRMVAAILFFVAMCGGVAWAEIPLEISDGVVATPDVEAPAPLNDPTGTIEVIKDFINRINPSYETVWDVYNGDFYQGMSGTLYDFTSREIPIASWRLGASTGMALYSGVSLDLPGLSQRFLPQSVTAVAETPPLDTVWSVIGKYGRVGIVGGWSFDHEDALVGITAGAALTF